MGRRLALALLLGVACCGLSGASRTANDSPSADGWENVDPDRRDPPPGKVLWRADFSQGEDELILEKAEGAEGAVSVDGGKLRIVKTNDIGYFALRPKVPFAVPPGTRLQAFAYVSGMTNDPEYAMGFLRLYGARKTYDYFSALDERRRGGPKMDCLFNTPPGVRERKLCRFLANAANGTNVTPVIVVAGPRSESVWSDWGMEDLRVSAANWKAFVKKVEPKDHSGDRQDEAEFDAALAADIDHTAKVVRKDGAPVLLVDGVETPPVFFKGKIQRDAAKNLYCGRRMEESGVRMQVVTVRFGDSPKMHGWWSQKGFDVRGAVREVKDAMRMAPKSLFVLTAILDAYPEFTAEHPDETWIAEDGCTVWGNQTHADYDLDPRKKRDGYWPWVSYSSTVWREAVRTNLVTLVDALKAAGLAKRIVGIHLGAFHDHQFATRRLDFSRPAIEGFRRWQKRTYGKVRWEGAPAFDAKLDYFTPGRDDHSIAYFRYLERQPFELQEDLVRTVKSRFGKDMIGVRWCMAPFGGTYGAAYDITPFVHSDAIDVIAPQADYSRRTPGAAIGLRLPCASLREHGKLMLCEFDLRTYAAVSGNESELTVIGDSQATDDAMWRALYRKCAGQQIASRMGWWLYDMAGGWYEPPSIAADIADSVKTVRRLAAMPQTGVASAAFVVDEDGALLRNLPSHWYNHDEERLFATQIQLLAGCGVPTDFWLADDLIRNPALAKRYRTLVFGGMYHIDAARRRLLEALQGEGRTLVFLAGTGASGGGDATGFSIVSESAPRSHRVVAESGVDVNMASFTDHLIWTKFLGGGKLAKHWQPRRDTVKEEADVKVMARFADNGEPAVAERAFGTGKTAWKSVMIGSAAGLTPQYFNALVRGAGGYVPAPYGLQVDMNGSFLSVHAIIPGRYDLRLPRRSLGEGGPGPCRVTNLKTGREVDAPGGVLTMELTAGETRWYGFDLALTEKKQ